MADKLLESSAISAFCSSVATMLAAGVQTDEAVHMLSENRAESQFKRVCDEAYSHLVAGETLSESMQATEAFPAYAVEMVRVGEASGRTERVLRSLGSYYDSERRSFAKLQNAVGYPAALFVCNEHHLGIHGHLDFAHLLENLRQHRGLVDKRVVFHGGRFGRHWLGRTHRGVSGHHRRTRFMGAFP